ncbi:proclotting enzyme-like [Macrobrachium rosenbergii]|uniref:proclotting enzyme-like n=1 Tax=Macrobrachium rosenbergii TaxID=79674 RepID=UPI0034D65A3D
MVTRTDCGERFIRDGESVLVLSSNAKTVVNCQITIKGPKGSRLSLRFPQFDLNPKGCNKEKLILQDKAGKFTGKFCLKNNPENKLTETASNTLKLTHVRKKMKKQCPVGFWCEVAVIPASLTKPESATESSSSSVKTSAEDTIATEATSSLKTISTAEPTTSVEITIITTATTTVELTTVTATATAVETITATETNISSSMGTSENQSSTLTHTSSPPANATSIVTRLYCAACGISAATVESRIVGGQEAKIGEYPWMVLVFITLKLGGHAICGGSLIKRKWVLSAAHCFHGLNYESVALFLGDHNIATNDEVPTTGFIAHTIRIHPQYDSYSQNNDIALLELSGEATFNERIQPVCLPNAEDVVPGKLAVATGWGYTQYGGSLSDVLREVEVSLISNSQCKKLYSGLATITSNMLCAYSSGKDACQGDSGGPLVTQLEDRRWVLAGIVSFGYRCAYPNTPGVYTHVVNYVPWITEVTTSTDC